MVRKNRKKTRKKARYSWSRKRGTLKDTKTGKTVKLSKYGRNLSKALSALKRGMGTGGTRSKRSKREDRKTYKSLRKYDFGDMSVKNPNDPSKGGNLVSGGGKFWWKGYKNVKTFSNPEDAYASSLVAIDKKTGKIASINVKNAEGKIIGTRGVAASRTDLEAMARYKYQKAKEKARAYRTMLSMEQAAAAQTRASFITSEKTAVESAIRQRIASLSKRRYGTRAVTAYKKRKQAWQTTLAKSRAHAGEDWFTKIPSILGSSASTGLGGTRGRGRKTTRDPLGLRKTKRSVLDRKLF